jgi:hypothetical protein
MFLGITEFTKAYLHIKDNPWPFINLVKLTQNSRINDNEVLELLRNANGYLPRVRLENDRLKEEMSSMKAELNNTARIYQGFCDRNLNLSKREHELQLSISELEANNVELQTIITEFQDHASMPSESNPDNDNLDIGIKQMERHLQLKMY